MMLPKGFRSGYPSTSAIGFYSPQPRPLFHLGAKSYVGSAVSLFTTRRTAPNGAEVIPYGLHDRQCSRTQNSVCPPCLLFLCNSILHDHPFLGNTSLSPIVLNLSLSFFLPPLASSCHFLENKCFYNLLIDDFAPLFFFS